MRPTSRYPAARGTRRARGAGDLRAALGLDLRALSRGGAGGKGNPASRCITCRPRESGGPGVAGTIWTSLDSRFRGNDELARVRLLLQREEASAGGGVEDRVRVYVVGLVKVGDFARLAKAVDAERDDRVAGDGAEPR